MHNEDLLERITNVVAYAEESQDFERAISIIKRQLEGMSDDQIMEEDNNPVKPEDVT